MRFIFTLLLVLCLGTVCAKEEKKYKVLILWSGMGEYEASKRLENACAKLGWEAKTSYCLEEISGLDFYGTDTPVTPGMIQEIVADFHPDFVLSLKEDRVFTHDVPNYLVISGICDKFFDEYFVEDTKYLEFDGFLYSAPS